MYNLLIIGAAGKTALLEKPGKPLCFRQGMKGQNLGFIISSIRLFFLNEVAKTPLSVDLIYQIRSPLTLVGGFSHYKALGFSAPRSGLPHTVGCPTQWAWDEFSSRMRGQYLLPLCTQTVFHWNALLPSENVFLSLAQSFTRNPFELI